MRTFQYLSADTRLTDELERQLVSEAILDQEGFDIVSDLRGVGRFITRKIAGLLNAKRTVKGLPGEYLYS